VKKLLVSGTENSVGRGVKNLHAQYALGKAAERG
jgi:hypothetical protein